MASTALSWWSLPAAIGEKDSERNLRNKISQGGLTGAFLIQCLIAMGVTTLRLED